MPSEAKNQYPFKSANADQFPIIEITSLEIVPDFLFATSVEVSISYLFGV